MPEDARGDEASENEREAEPSGRPKKTQAQIDAEAVHLTEGKGFTREPPDGTKAEGLSAERRALSMLAIYLWERARIKNPNWKTHWQRANGEPNVSIATIKDLMASLREAPVEIKEKDWPKVRLLLEHVLTHDVRTRYLLDDLDLMGPALQAAGLEEVFRPNIRDYRLADDRLITTMELKEVTPPEVERLCEELVGLWHVIRPDTDPNEPDSYNVSLLSIKPPEHVRQDDDGRLVGVLSRLPRFSFRSPGRTTKLQVYRGVVVRVKEETFFLATREDSTNHLVLMTWGQLSRVDHSELGPHAADASGFITTPNSRGELITAPVCAHLIMWDFPDSAARGQKRPSKARGWIPKGATMVWDHQTPDSDFLKDAAIGYDSEPSSADIDEAAFWTERIEWGRSRIGVYDKKGLAALQRHNDQADISTNIDHMHSRAKGRFFEL